MPERDLVSWNAVLSGYVNAGRIGEAKSFFREMPERNLLTWTVMISGLAQNGFGEEGLKLFNQMKLEGFEPCDYAFAGAIISCAGLGALEHGRQLHAQLVRYGFDSSLSTGNALITMYARCGVVEAARSVFLTMPYVDSVSWNAMIAALGQHGRGVQAIELFEEMLKEGILPDRITFLTVLSACSHAGLVIEGRRYFGLIKTMISDCHRNEICHRCTLKLTQVDFRSVANRYVAQLQLCCPQSPISYPPTRTAHAYITASGFRPRDEDEQRAAQVKGTNLKMAALPSIVVVLTEYNFNEIVLDETKDILVEFYAPCGLKFLMVRLAVLLKFEDY
ncbi:hypothetical protein L1049_016785 [Liquidambar formosana]|uniref:Pentatricopeptide repeat-containing protein n=1 Tax=Liquidambar formosana TaxID=63359 RepID=A0AAP0S702_LIQFO